MPVNTSAKAASDAAFELKGSTFTLPLLKLLAADMDLVADQLADKVKQAPDFFRNTPVVIDLHELAAGEILVDFALLVGLLRGYGMIPIGVRGGSAVQNEAACAMELAILADGRAEPARKAVAPAQENRPPEPSPQPVAPVQGGRLVTRPIRSGQRVYAQGGDLTVIAHVSSGAELLADGNIHVYGSLRGRALAGVKGNRECRIFCKDLRAELVSVAGHYRVSENLDASKVGKPVQIYLEDQSLVIEDL